MLKRRPILHCTPFFLLRFFLGCKKKKQLSFRNFLFTPRTSQHAGKQKMTATDTDKDAIPLSDFDADEIVSVTKVGDVVVPQPERHGVAELIYKTKSGFDNKIYFVTAVSIAFAIVSAILFVFQRWSFAVLFALSAVFVVVTFFLKRPKTIEIYSDRLVTLSPIFPITTMLSDITEVQATRHQGPYQVLDWFKGKVIIRRRNKKRPLYLTPLHPEEFMAFLDHAICPSEFPRPTIGFDAWASPVI
jgi:hypothetical protein